MHATFQVHVYCYSNQECRTYFPLGTQQEPLYGPLRAAETPCIVLDLHCKTPFQSLEHRGIIMISEEGWRLKSNQIYSSGLEDTLSTLV